MTIVVFPVAILNKTLDPVIAKYYCWINHFHTYFRVCQIKHSKCTRNQCKFSLYFLITFKLVIGFYWKPCRNPAVCYYVNPSYESELEAVGCTPIYYAFQPHIHSFNQSESRQFIVWAACNWLTDCVVNDFRARSTSHMLRSLPRLSALHSVNNRHLIKINWYKWRNICMSLCDT